MRQVWFNYELHLYITTSRVGVKVKVVDINMVRHADTR